jgi:hypothetical protein
MSRTGTIAALVLLASCGQQPTAKTTSLADDFALRPAAIALPPDNVTLPPSAERVTINCSACHSAEMILSQPVLGAETWQKEIDKMRTAYRASIDPRDDRALVAMLVRLQEKPAIAP